MSLPSDTEIEAIEGQVRENLARLNRPDPNFTLVRTPRNDGGFHIEPTSDGFAWIQSERGAELSRTSATAQEVVFLALEALTRDYAQQAELQARHGAAYSMRRWVEAHIRLMRHLDPAWGVRLEAHYEKALAAHPLRAEEVRAAVAPLDLSSFGIDESTD